MKHAQGAAQITRPGLYHFADIQIEDIYFLMQEAANQTVAKTVLWLRRQSGSIVPMLDSTFKISNHKKPFFGSITLLDKDAIVG